MTPHDPHLDTARIQELLDRELTPRAESRVRAHLDGCAACRAEVEAWEGVFARLGSLEEIDPPPVLAREVLRALESPERRERRSITARILDRLPFVPGRSAHPAPALLQSFVDGALSSRRTRKVEDHVAGCPGCAADLARWESLVSGLAALGRTAPSAGFADRVMAEVRVPEARARAAVAASGSAVPTGLRRFLPRSRRGWVMAAVPVVVPVAALTLSIVAFFSSYPLLTPGSAISFFWWQMTGAVDAALASVSGYVLGSPLVLDLMRAVEAAIVDPVQLRSAAILVSGLIVAALWILYRNLTTTPPVDRGYANGSA